jgi:hypothetical protein
MMFVYNKFSDMMKWIEKKMGRGGTNPARVVEAIIQSNIKSEDYHLILITDGEIHVGAVDETDRMIEENKVTFSYVTVYVIGRGIFMNLSVQAAFSRYSGSRVITLNDDRNYEEVEPDVVVSQEDLELLEGISQIKNYNQFLAQYDGIKRALTARVLGTVGDR